MTKDVIQAQYDDLVLIARRFEQFAESTRDLEHAVRSAYQPLGQGSWQGRGVAAFSFEMEAEVLPAVMRMANALSIASSTTHEIAIVLRDAELEAAALFQAAGGEAYPLSSPVVAALDALLGGVPGGQGTSSLFGAGTAFVNSTVGGVFSPLSPWATAPFAAGAALLGPGPIPLFGRFSHVPDGFANAGKRFMLYFGGAGKDTIFSIHPSTGFGRPPYKLPSPDLRFDYGPINVKSGNAYLRNGTTIPVPHDTNFFHWNRGSGKSFGAWRTLEGGSIRDHQLLSNNLSPKGNILGRIPGAKLVRGASRIFAGAGVAMDVYSVATADNMVQEGTRRGAAWGGAWLGAKGGAAVGASIGTFFGPGPGTAIGGAVGGIVGGIGGYFGGYEVGDMAYDALQ